jgi:predicted SAM-dependent methyltransferase
MDKDKLNLCSGKTYLPSYWNVDVRSNCKTDQTADMRTVEFPSESFREIILHDCIDHVKRSEAPQVLKKCFGWLKPNGILDIHTPNLRFIASILSNRDNDSALEWLYGSIGEGTTDYEENLIRWSYSVDSLTKILIDIGFTILGVNSTCNGFGFRVIAIKKLKLDE